MDINPEINPEYATVKTIHIMFDILENTVRKLIAKRKVNVYRLGRSVKLKISEMRALLKRGQGAGELQNPFSIHPDLFWGSVYGLLHLYGCCKLSQMEGEAGERLNGKPGARGFDNPILSPQRMAGP